MIFGAALLYSGVMGMPDADDERKRYLADRDLVFKSFVTASCVTSRDEDCLDAELTRLVLDDECFFEEGMELPSSGGVVVRFKHKPQVVVETTQGYAVPTWNVRFPFPTGGSYHQLGEEMCRRFVQLARDAKRGMLTEETRKTWLRILEDIDYADYCAQVKPPLRTSGRRIRLEGDAVVIKMRGGDEEIVDGVIAEDLKKMVRDGERFTVTFKRRNRRIEVFKDICPEPDVEVDVERVLQRARTHVEKRVVARS